MQERIRDNGDGTRTVWHGAYGWRTHYEVAMLWYAGTSAEDGNGGFVEILEIKNPPLSRHPFLLHAYYTDIGSSCFEFASHEDAEAGRETLFRGGHLRKLNDPSHIPELPKCLRAERPKHDEPWVYSSQLDLPLL